MAALAGLLADDVDLEPPADLPDPGPFHGGDEAARFLLSLADSWDEFRVDVEAVLAADDDRAVARLHLSARGTGSGIQTVGTLIGAFWMRDGRIQRLRLGRDEAEALAATGLDGP